MGSTSLVTDEEGNETSRIHYSPYGAIIEQSGSLPTDRLFTGQRREESIQLYDYRARFYDPLTANFLSPDSIVPQPGNPVDWNRYAYVRGNPVRYSDPSGHQGCDGVGNPAIMLASHCENIGGPPNGNGSGGAAFTVPTLIVIGLTAYYGTQAFLRNVGTLLDTGVDVGVDVYAQPQSRATATVECCPVMPTPTRTPRTIVELGSGDFSNLVIIAGEHYNDRVIGLEGNPIQYQLGIRLGNVSAAETLGAEARLYDFSNGLPPDVRADEIIAIAPSPFNKEAYVRASLNVNPGARIYMAVVEEHIAQDLARRLSEVHNTQVDFRLGQSRYPSLDFTGREITYGPAYIIDFSVR